MGKRKPAGTTGLGEESPRGNERGRARRGEAPRGKKMEKLFANGGEGARTFEKQCGRGQLQMVGKSERQGLEGRGAHEKKALKRERKLRQR